MGIIKGETEYKRFSKGERLSYKKAILAQCYVCNGLNESNIDCQGKNCPLYQFQPYRNKGQGMAAKTA
jgi:hypothetical protein